LFLRAGALETPSDARGKAVATRAVHQVVLGTNRPTKGPTALVVFGKVGCAFGEAGPNVWVPSSLGAAVSVVGTDAVRRSVLGRAGFLCQ
jgi:hypothetical protein